MAYDDLREWIRALEKAQEIKSIKQEVDPILEMAEIADRVSKLGSPTCAAGGPALMFENVKGYPGAKVLMNQFGSERRMRLALGVDSLSEVADRIRELMNLRSPEGFLDKVRMLPMLAEMGKFFPKLVSAKDAPCKEVILRENFSVLDFPILQCWPQDGGRFITLPCVVTRDPRSPAGKRNVGMYRMQVYDGQTTGMHWQRQKVAAEHYRERLRQAAEANSGAAANSEDAASARVARMAETAGGAMLPPNSTVRSGISPQAPDRLQVAVAIGTDPATTFSAIVPAPPEVEEFIIAGFLRQKPVELVQCETVDLQVPAASEIVLEGYVRIDELRSEGPFGDHTGFYTLPDDYPVFHITCITHRRDPIYATTIVGKPPMEDAYMGKAVERVFLPLMRLTIPELIDINLPIEGVFHNLMIVSIRKSYPGQAR
ncbi:MAG: UbiD family decarboxylase domain-containing protein, partial [Acidobacteriaceae bacterium]